VKVISTDSPEWLTPAETAALMRVNPKTVWRWAREGKITAGFTPGGHRRFRRAELEAMLNGQPDGRR
jgi:excisionase family DNA binding protein